MSSDGHLEEKRSRPSTAATAAAVPEKEKGEESPVPVPAPAKKGFFGRKKEPVVEEEKPDAVEIAAGKADKVPPVGFTQLFRYAFDEYLHLL